MMQVPANTLPKATCGFFRMAEASQTAIYDQAARLSDAHTPVHFARSPDRMHVAAALICKARVFLSTDEHQRKVARAEGLKVRP